MVVPINAAPHRNVRNHLVVVRRAGRRRPDVRRADVACAAALCSISIKNILEIVGGRGRTPAEYAPSPWSPVGPERTISPSTYLVGSAPMFPWPSIPLALYIYIYICI
jgi:hypothetical protein